MKQTRKKRPLLLRVLLGLFAALILAACVYGRFGGFGTGKSADTAEFAKYAAPVSKLTVPDQAKIIALGEATHGNAEFQQLRLDVFQIAVGQYGVRAFALEADCGCCEIANRYIHGGDGTAEQAAAALGFQIDRTDETAQLLHWMRAYNEQAAEGEDLRLYGFDMQRFPEELVCLLEAAKAAGADTAALEPLLADDASAGTDNGLQTEALVLALKAELLMLDTPQAAQAAHYADVALQNLQLGKAMENPLAGMALRDKLMADNVQWVLAQEQARGNARIFLSGHNGHISQSGSYDAENDFMGHILADAVGQDAYFAIGTDFYKATVNMPKGSEKRTRFTVYSHDPLAKAAKNCGYDICWLDFSKIPESSALKSQVEDYCFMGNLGENQLTLLNRLVMRAVPYTYRLWGSPAALYDGMIFVTQAHPTQIR